MIQDSLFSSFAHHFRQARHRGQSPSLSPGVAGPGGNGGPGGNSSGWWNSVTGVMYDGGG